MEELKPYLGGPNKDVLDTQVDVVTNATLGAYTRAQGTVLKQ
jgi:hypothetical protein